MANLEKLVAAFASIARPEIRQNHTAASCVASTWITIEVMRYFEVPARPVTVKTEVSNAPYLELERKLGRRPDPGATENGAWLVGIGVQKEQGCIGAHLVAILDNRILVDASIDQANDPEHGIVLPGVVWTHINEAFLAGTPLACRVSGQRLTYFPSGATLDFRSLYDWGHNLQTDGAVARIISRLEGLVTTGPPAP
jgi:hypothetical protein